MQYRKVIFLTLVTERTANRVHALYNVVDTNAEGATRRLVRVDIDLNPEALGQLAWTAVDSTSGEATLYGDAITARVQE